MKSTTRKAKRFLAGLLCMGMLVTSLPATVLAAELGSGSDPGADASVAEETTSVAAQEESSAGDTSEDEADEAEDADEGDAAVAAAEETEAYIATCVGQVPEELADAEGVTADLFDTAWETVSVTVDSTTYYVEVVPEGTVYFIDSVAAAGSNGSMADVTTTEPYAAVAALLGDQLLNEKSDQFKTSDTTWGLVDTDAKTKGYDNITTDKMATGIYGANNTTGETLTYSLTLSAGTYTLASGHHEWWGMTRPMSAVVQDADGSTLASSTISLSGSSGDIINELSFTVTEEQVITYTITCTGSQAPVISWLGVERTGDAEETDPDTGDDDEEEVPTEPDLSSYNFCDPLEDNDGLTLAASTISTEITGCGIVIDNEVQWNNGGDYHATVNDASVFQNGSFTLLFDIRQDAPSGDTNVTDQRSAFTIGNSTNCIHVLTWSGKFGYGSSSSGISGNSVTLSGVEAGGWNAVALTYEESGSTASVKIYVNGVLAGEVEDLGFQFSSMSDISAMIIRSFNTNYLQEGRYDGIIVSSSVMSEEDAIAATAYRKYAKDNLPANVIELQAAVDEANALVATGITSDDLESALAVGEALLARTDLTAADDQDTVDAATTALLEAIALLNPEEIVISAEDVASAAESVNGLTYKGFGILSGNSTSNLLLDYKSEDADAYWEMLEYLFGGDYPLFTNIKMEMGNDGNNSTGAEACTMRYEDEEADASRDPGFALAADAKKINPDVKTIILRWGMPNWVSEYWSSDKTGAGYEAMYKWYSETIFDVYEKYGYIIDYVNPDTNETSTADSDFIKWFADKVENETDFPDYFTEEAIEAYHNIKILASDENKTLTIVSSMYSDEDLFEDVDAVGFHYRTSSNDNTINLADVYDKEVWYSEGCATFGYTELQENKTSTYGYESIGGYQSPLALVDSFITAFVYSRRTNYIFQPAIGAFYEGIQYGHKELLSARDPWSGYVHYDPALYMVAHFSQFAKTGWENDDNTEGIWRVITNATSASYAGTTSEHATTGIDGDAGYMTLADPNGTDFSTVFVNNTQNAKAFSISTEDMENISADQVLYVWTTETDSYMQLTDTVEQVNGSWYISVPAYSVVTATTLETEPQRIPTEDNGGVDESYIDNEDRTVLDTDDTGKTADATDDYLYADNFEYNEEQDVEQYNAATETTTLVDYLESRGDEPRYMLDTHGAWIVEDGRLKQELSASVSQWNSGDPTTIVGDFRWMDYSASVDVEIPDGDSSTYMRLTIRSQTGMNWGSSGYTLSISGDGQWVLYRVGTSVARGSVTASAEGKYNLKLTGLGSTIYAYIDGVQVTSYTDSSPMLSGRVKISSSWDTVYADNLEVKTVSGGTPYALSMIDGQDDDVSYDGAWTIDNPGSGSADNWYRTISTSSTAGSSLSFPISGTGFALIGSNSGTVLDIYVDGELVDDNVTATTSVTRGETYTLTGLTDGAHTVKVELVSGTLNVDAIYTLGDNAIDADDSAIESVATDLPTLDYWVTGTEMSGLPETVEAVTYGGETVTVAVEWNIDEDALAECAFGSASVTGTLKDVTNSLGDVVTVTVSIGEVIPADTLYLIDVVNADASEETTETYDLYAEALGDQLLNQKNNQLYTDGATWGLVDTDAGTKAYTSTADKMNTGIYGANNASGETLTYALTLPAGTYELTSGHHEWWSMTRPMTLVVTDANGNALTDTVSISLSSSTTDVINTMSFTLEEEQVVYYTITATGTQAPVISWLAVTGSVTEEVVEFAIVTQPEDVTAEKGDTATFAVEATGTDLTYQWQYQTASGSKWYNCTATTGAGYASDSITLTANKGRNGYKYHCVVTNGDGETLASEQAVLTVTTPVVVDPITVTAQPADVTAEKGSSATFTVEAVSNLSETLTYQWQYKTASGTSWNNCTATTGTGYASDSITLTANKGRNGYSYRCKLTDETGNTAYSDAATLTVTTPVVVDPITITTQPEAVTAVKGSSATFNVAAVSSSGEELTYRWQYMTAAGSKWYNCTATSGDGYKSDTLTLTANKGRNGYSYRCAVMDESGNTVYSDAVTLTVTSE